MLLGMLLSLEGSQLPAFTFSNFFCCFLRNLPEHASISAVFAGSLTERKEGCFIGRDISCARALWLWDILVKRHCLLVALCDRVADFPHWVPLDKAALRTGMGGGGHPMAMYITGQFIWGYTNQKGNLVGGEGSLEGHMKGQTACRC